MQITPLQKLPEEPRRMRDEIRLLVHQVSVLSMPVVINREREKGTVDAATKMTWSLRRDERAETRENPSPLFLFFALAHFGGSSFPRNFLSRLRSTILHDG